MKTKLDELLKALHEEVQRADPVDETGRELLREVSADIQALLARADETQPAGLSERWQRALQHFEVTHPDLTAVLSSVSSILSNAGI
ncbi:MAG: DUF4404 family protein [Anaerolineales bacterium]